MPVYEYVCRSCAHEFEELVFGQEAPVCPECGQSDVRKLLSVINVGSSRGSVPREPRGACAGCSDAGSGACPLSRG